jgi:hypothetical protein
MLTPPAAGTLRVVFNWRKNPSDALRKLRAEDIARRPSRPPDQLPDRPSLDGYIVSEIPMQQAAQLFERSASEPTLTPAPRAASRAEHQERMRWRLLAEG